MAGADEGLLWGEGNLGHVTGHDVSVDEIEQLFWARDWVLADEPQGRPRQYRMVGWTPVQGGLW